MNYKKLKTLDLSYFIGKSHFEEDGAQNYLVFQPIHRYFKIIHTKYISSWKSKGLSNKTIARYTTSDNSLTPLIDHYGSKVRIKFNKGCLKWSDKLTYDYGHRTNVYIVYELGASSSNDSDPTLKNCLFGAVTLTKNADIENMGILVMELYLIEEEVFGQNVLMFGVDMSSSAHIDNKKKNILVLGIGPT